MLLLCRVLDIMRKDAKGDPATNPNTMHARNLVNQVFVISRSRNTSNDIYIYIFFDGCNGGNKADMT